MKRVFRSSTKVVPVLLAAVTALAGCGVGQTPGTEDDDGSFPVLTGQYLGQTPPGDEPGLFAPGIVSTGMYERDIAITPDGRELYYCVVLGNYDQSVIMVARLEDGHWTRPSVASFSGRHRDLEPAITPDGRRFLFVSHRPIVEGDRAREDADIWVMDKTEDGWGEPYPLGPPVNTGDPEFFPSVTRDGTLYLTRDQQGGASAIYRSRLVEGHYQEPERLGPEVNSARAQFNSYVSPDETYLVYGAFGREDSLGGTDYYVSFRNDDDTWTGPISLGRRINTKSGLEYSPYVTPDGRYFFFMTARTPLAEVGFDLPTSAEGLLEIHGRPGNGLPDIWWVDAGFIEQLRPAGR
jgi:hypothetical protein